MRVGKHWINFQYTSHVPVQTIWPGTNRQGVRSICVCAVQETEIIDGQLKTTTVAQGTAVMNPNDKVYNKSLARRLAFTRAIAGFSKTARTACWKKFREEVKQ